MSTLQELREEKNRILAKSEEIINNATKAQRNLTVAESALVDRNMKKVNDELLPRIREKEKQVEQSEKALSDLIAFGSSTDEDGQLTKYLQLTGERGRKAASAAVAQMREYAEETGRKAFDGSQTVRTILTPEPLDIKRVPTSIIDMLRVVPRETPKWMGIKQTGFTNNASIVPAGATKPTSTVTITNVDGELSVIAHLSEPVDKYLLADNTHLTDFIYRNLWWGLKETLEEEVLSGDGSTFQVGGVNTKHFTGILHTSGVQEQASTGDRVVTLRAASTKLETAGFTTSAYVLNPLDWEAIETYRNQSGAFDLGSAVNLAERRVWGSQVVTSNRIEQGSAIALDLSSLNLDTDMKGIEVLWDGSGQLFEKNQLRARVEGRFGLSIERPEGIVVASLAESTGS